MKYTTKNVPSYHVRFNDHDYSFWGESVSLLQDVEYARLGVEKYYGDAAQNEESIFNAFGGFQYDQLHFSVLVQTENQKPVFFRSCAYVMSQSETVRQAFESDSVKFVYVIDEYGRWLQFEKGDLKFRVECQVNKTELDLLFRSLRNTVTQLHNNQERILKNGYGEDNKSFKRCDEEIKQVKNIMSKVTYTEE